MELFHAYAIFRKRWLLIVAMSLLAAAAAGALVGYQRPVYRATTTISTGIAQNADWYSTGLRLADMQAVLLSRQLLGRLNDELQLDASLDDLRKAIRVTRIADSGVLQIDVTWTDPDHARDAANTQAKLFIDYHTGQLKGQAEREVQLLEQQLQVTQDRLQRAQANRPNPSSVAPGDPEALAMDEEVSAARQALSQMLNKLAIARVSANNSGAGGPMSVIDPATTPSEPEPNNLTRTVAFGGLLGLLLGISLAVGRELMDSRPRLLDILENELGVTILAVVPWQRHFGRRFYPALDKLGRLRREAFQRLRTSVLVRRRARAMLAASVASNGRRHTEPMALLVVSDRSGSGCSSVVSNLGASLANGGQRVVLVDTNFAHPSLHLFADGYAEPGVSQWLSDSTINVSEMIQPTHVRGLFLLASGGSDPSASDRLVQPGIDELVLELRSAYDFILLDSPSLARSSDAELLRSAIDAIVLVARPHGQLHERDIREAVQFAGDKLLGIVLNGLTIPRNLIALNSPPRPLSAAETIFDEQATGAAKRLLRERG